MKKIIFSFFCIITTNFCFAQLWGSKTFTGRTVGSQQSNWCVFACIEMKTQKTSEQCLVATAYARMYNDTQVNCCNDMDAGFKTYCLPGVPLLRLPHFLNEYHHAVGYQVTNIYQEFVHHSTDILSYEFPCYGLIRSLQHCVIVTGIEATYSGRDKVWKVYIIDPGKGGNREVKTYYDFDESIGLIFI